MARIAPSIICGRIVGRVIEPQLLPAVFHAVNGAGLVKAFIDDLKAGDKGQGTRYAELVQRATRTTSVEMYFSTWTHRIGFWMMLNFISSALA